MTIEIVHRSTLICQPASQIRYCMLGGRVHTVWDNGGAFEKVNNFLYNLAGTSIQTEETKAPFKTTLNRVYTMYSCTCTHTHTHTYIHTYIHTRMHTYIHIHTVHTHIHTYIHTYVRTYIHNTYIYTYLHTYVHTCMHAYIPTYIRTYVSAHILYHTGQHTQAVSVYVNIPT